MNYKNVTFNSKDIISILEKLGFTNIVETQTLFTFSWYDGSNPKGACLFKESMSFSYWSKNLHGDFISLIQTKSDCSFPEALSFIKDYTNKELQLNKNETENYSDFVNKIKPKTYKTYDIEIYKEYNPCLSYIFLKDNVGFMAQMFFDIRIDDDSNRIIFPIKDIDGNLVGILGRYNELHPPKNIAKYLPIIPYEKKLFLFGAYENKDYLHDTIIITESEKSVMKAFTLGYRNVVALGGNYFSPERFSVLYKLEPKTIILALDEGLEDKHIKETAKSLISPNPFVQWHIGYIPSNSLGLGKKNNIFDEQKDVCENILKNEVIYIY